MAVDLDLTGAFDCLCPADSETMVATAARSIPVSSSLKRTTSRGVAIPRVKVCLEGYKSQATPERANHGTRVTIAFARFHPNKYFL
jgi:hypothetical protein